MRGLWAFTYKLYTFFFNIGYWNETLHLDLRPSWLNCIAQIMKTYIVFKSIKSMYWRFQDKLEAVASGSL